MKETGLVTETGAEREATIVGVQHRASKWLTHAMLRVLWRDRA